MQRDSSSSSNGSHAAMAGAVEGTAVIATATANTATTTRIQVSRTPHTQDLQIDYQSALRRRTRIEITTDELTCTCTQHTTHALRHIQMPLSLTRSNYLVHFAVQECTFVHSLARYSYSILRSLAASAKVPAVRRGGCK